MKSCNCVQRNKILEYCNIFYLIFIGITLKVSGVASFKTKMGREEQY